MIIFFNKSVNNATPLEKRTMMTQSSETDSKYQKDVVINKNIKVNSYIDFGRDCVLIRQDVVENNFLPVSHELSTIR